jgi:hypothetical protein
MDYHEPIEVTQMHDSEPRFAEGLQPIITLCDRSSFRLDEPETQRFDVVVIAHALSKICRFTGHISGTSIYSVAQHSVLVSYMVPVEDALDGLLHDAHEAYVGDMSAPLKLLCPDYCRVERRVEVACRRSFGLADTKSEAVAEADKHMFKSEYAAYLTSEVGIQVGRRYGLNSIRAWLPEIAKSRFLERFEELARADQWSTPPVL